MIISNHVFYFSAMSKKFLHHLFLCCNCIRCLQVLSFVEDAFFRFSTYSAANHSPSPTEDTANVSRRRMKVGKMPSRTQDVLLYFKNKFLHLRDYNQRYVKMFFQITIIPLLFQFLFNFFLPVFLGLLIQSWIYVFHDH